MPRWPAGCVRLRLDGKWRRWPGGYAGGTVVAIKERARRLAPTCTSSSCSCGRALESHRAYRGQATRNEVAPRPCHFDGGPPRLMRHGLSPRGRTRTHRKVRTSANLRCSGIAPSDVGCACDCGPTSECGCERSRHTASWQRSAIAQCGHRKRRSWRSPEGCRHSQHGRPPDTWCKAAFGYRRRNHISHMEGSGAVAPPDARAGRRLDYVLAQRCSSGTAPETARPDSRGALSTRMSAIRASADWRGDVRHRHRTRDRLSTPRDRFHRSSRSDRRSDR